MTSSPTAALAVIPVVNVGLGEEVRHALEGRERAQSLRDECVGWLPAYVRPLLPMIDAMTRSWLKRSASPYVDEIAAIAAGLGHSGIWFLNGCYQWGCTSLVREEEGTPWLARTLDWPFHGLGRNVEIARMHGPAGAYDAVTWPGFVGALTASAPGRFAACINQAPLLRRTRHPWLRSFDIALNAVATRQVRFIPPDHLLRHVFETCGSFDEAHQRLETTPVARPVIYTLAGCRSGERCVIERTEEDFKTREQETGAANDWLEPRPPWEARVSSRYMFTRTFEEAAARNLSRREGLATWPGRFAQGSFAWVAPPVLNSFTRVAVEMCPRLGVLRAVGYETPPDSELAQPVTQTCELAVVA